MEPLRSLTIWSQINQVQMLQNNTRKYLKHYEESILESLIHNQFLQGHIPQPQSNRQQTKVSVISQQDQLVEAWMHNNDDEIHISRIFKQINLQRKLIQQSPSMNTLQIQLQLQDEKILLELNRNNIYSLSNFNSFKDLKQKQQLSYFQFEDLVTLIQTKCFKKLTKNGIESLIQQLSTSVKQLSTNNIDRQQDQTQKNTKYAESLVTLSDSNILNIKCDDLFSSKLHDGATNNKFDYQLNNNYKTKNSIKTPLIQNNKYKYNFNKKMQKKVDNQRIVAFKKQQKENNSLMLDKKPDKLTKQLKIIKRTGQSKVNLILLYNDGKQVQNFCISNKIYGKDKEKIYKAIKNNTPLINLQ